MKCGRPSSCRASVSGVDYKLGITVGDSGLDIVCSRRLSRVARSPYGTEGQTAGGQRDRQTDRRTDKTRNVAYRTAASYLKLLSE